MAENMQIKTNTHVEDCIERVKFRGRGGTWIKKIKICKSAGWLSTSRLPISSNKYYNRSGSDFGFRWAEGTPFPVASTAAAVFIWRQEWKGSFEIESWHGHMEK